MRRVKVMVKMRDWGVKIVMNCWRRCWLTVEGVLHVGASGGALLGGDGRAVLEVYW